MNIIYQNVQNLRDLTLAGYYFDEEKETPLASFFKGYIFSDKDLEKYINQYLWQYFGIDPVKNTLEQQIDHYAFERGFGWERGFIHLMNNIIENADVSEDLYGDITAKASELEDKPVYVYEGAEELIPEQINNLQDSIQLKNGDLVKVGDIVQLNDKIGEDYKKTKFYDMSIRNPSFELFYPSEKDFQYVTFYYKENEKIVSDWSSYFTELEKIAPFNFGRVRRLFSESVSKIEYISIQGENIFLYTDLFKIEMEKALEAEEIKLLPKTNNPPILSDFSNLLLDIHTHRGNRGISKMSEMMEILNYWSFYHFSFLKKEWNRFGRGMSGHWFKRE